jgi:hypothetical protein
MGEQQKSCDPRHRAICRGAEGAWRVMTDRGGKRRPRHLRSTVNSVCGKVRPSAFAVLRFRTSLNLVGCSTGRSAGFAPDTSPCARAVRPLLLLALWHRRSICDLLSETLGPDQRSGGTNILRANINAVRWHLEFRHATLPNKSATPLWRRLAPRLYRLDRVR